MQESTPRFLKRITEDKENIVLLPVASPLSPSVKELDPRGPIPTIKLETSKSNKEYSTTGLSEGASQRLRTVAAGRRSGCEPSQQQGSQLERGRARLFAR